MLFLLTGRQRIGKTRWLTDAVARAEASGIAVFGVIAPGVWSPDADGKLMTKLAIDNELLPGHRRVRFAVARSKRDGMCDGGDADGREDALGCMAWDVDPQAVSCVNDHFARLRDSRADSSVPGLLVVDELGPFELVRGDGLTEALALVDAGPSAAFPHVLAVIREPLLRMAKERFARSWGEGGMRVIFPEKDSPSMVCAAFGIE